LEEDMLVEKRNVTNEIPYFGGCPECLKTDGYLNVQRDHFFVCHEHRVFWYVGSNLFSSYETETRQQWDRNAAVLGGYREVEAARNPPEWYANDGLGQVEISNCEV
jgi:hypothetical protein